MQPGHPRPPSTSVVKSQGGVCRARAGLDANRSGTPKIYIPAFNALAAPKSSQVRFKILQDGRPWCPGQASSAQCPFSSVCLGGQVSSPVGTFTPLHLYLPVPPLSSLVYAGFLLGQCELYCTSGACARRRSHDRHEQCGAAPTRPQTGSAKRFLRRPKEGRPFVTVFHVSTLIIRALAGKEAGLGWTGGAHRSPSQHVGSRPSN